MPSTRSKASKPFGEQAIDVDDRGFFAQDQLATNELVDLGRDEVQPSSGPP